MNAEDRFGRNLKRIREELELSQSELAELARGHGVNLHPTAIAKIEARDAAKPRSIRLNEAAAIAGALGRTLEEMLHGPEAIFAETADRMERALGLQRRVEREISDALELLRSTDGLLIDGQTASDLGSDPALKLSRHRIVLALAEIVALQRDEPLGDGPAEEVRNLADEIENRWSPERIAEYEDLMDAVWEGDVAPEDRDDGEHPEEA